MEFDLKKSLEILDKTPTVLEAMLQGLSDEWIFNNEGDETWSPYDVIGHLIHGEKTDWIPRLEIILAQQGGSKFDPFDRFAQFKNSEGKTLHQLLEEFKILRKHNLEIVRNKKLTNLQYTLKGMHPSLEEVTLAQLLATWVVHDLNHIAQVARVMAKQYKHEVGPWFEYLGILK
ncbi:DinB family protein [Chryseotalea sanaruensis]|uniref:DinB family protein n=1 Tax=Chryseotalea sanaruensis TaxID=2482724 RepID=A0A401UBJ5_9BACT|nr:DinB family protein [Chryseotalea sanaruensis]GCC52267.1 DinB family protein [Chryseotalea sanaruensis]